ncbi:MAG: RNase adapter RapZ [Steroidobacteraceae bacterium]
MRLVIVSGLSGSGKSVALAMLEDLDYYCVDNIPAGLLPGFIAYTVRTSEPAYRLTAVGVDARNRPEDLADVPRLVAELRRSGIGCEVLFLSAANDVLLKRFSETRRRHPLSRAGLGLQDALEQELRLLAPVAAAADLTIDTSTLSVHELRETIRARVVEHPASGPSLLFESFAYRHGVPDDADFVFDARALPNPYWEAGLRDLTGRDAAVARFLDGQEEVGAFLSDLIGFLERWMPSLVRSNRSYLTVAVGCTGGQHRSVYLAEKLAAHFNATLGQALVRHRDLASRRHE